MFQSQFHGGLDLSRGVFPVQQQHADKILDARSFTLAVLEPDQEFFQPRRPALPPLPDGPGLLKGAGTLLNQFEIMVRGQLPFIIAKDPRVGGQPLRRRGKGRSGQCPSGPAPSTLHTGWGRSNGFYPL